MSVETEMLRGYLDQGRRHVLGIVEGLTDEQLRQPVLPSGWNCVGLINHLAVDVERFWFRAVMIDDRGAWESFQRQDGSAWDVAEAVSPRTVVALYEDEIRLANEVIAVTPLGTEPAAWPADLFGSFRLDNLRQMMLHVTTETACHAGHLDAARELLDQRQWMVLDGGRRPIDGPAPDERLQEGR